MLAVEHRFVVIILFLYEVAWRRSPLVVCLSSRAYVASLRIDAGQFVLHTKTSQLPLDPILDDVPERSLSPAALRTSAGTFRSGVRARRLAADNTASTGTKRDGHLFDPEDPAFARM